MVGPVVVERMRGLLSRTAVLVQRTGGGYAGRGKCCRDRGVAAGREGIGRGEAVEEPEGGPSRGRNPGPWQRWASLLGQRHESRTDCPSERKNPWLTLDCSPSASPPCPPRHSGPSPTFTPRARVRRRPTACTPGSRWGSPSSLA